MISDQKKLALENAYKAGVHAQIDRTLSFLLDRIASCGHVACDSCLTCMAWRQVISELEDNPTPVECSCDFCGSLECDCYGQRCEYCKAKD